VVAPFARRRASFNGILIMNVSRRDAIKLAMGAGFALAMQRAPAALGETVAADPSKKVRIGFIGVGDRGTGLLKVTLNAAGVEVPAVCDIDPAASKRAQDLVQKALAKRPEAYEKGPPDYRRLLERDDIDAVLIATPQELHAEMAIDSFKAKKFVGSEVPACTTLDECWALVKAQRETSGGYMLLENYLYGQPVMMVQNMVDKGLFGDLTYGFGAYIHEIRGMRFNKDGSLTWRGYNVLKNRGIVYPTHAIAPVCRWMGIDGVKDSLQTLVAMDSKPAGTNVFAAEKFGADSAPAKINFENGDTNQALIHTKQGRLIEVRYDTSSPRPSGMGQYSLQGTKASYDSAFGLRKIFIEGRTPAHQWEDLEKYEKEYQHPYWAKQGEQAKSAGHGGGDWFVISDFIQAVRSGKSPIDIYDAVAWTSIRPLSEQSIRSGSQPVEVPDFRKT
jgi:predicted dehydrogenase